MLGRVLQHAPKTSLCSAVEYGAEQMTSLRKLGADLNPWISHPPVTEGRDRDCIFSQAAGRVDLGTNYRLCILDLFYLVFASVILTKDNWIMLFWIASTFPNHFWHILLLSASIVEFNIILKNIYEPILWLVKEKECVKSEINQIMLLADYRFRALTSVQMNYQQGIFHVIFTLSECLRSTFSTFSR